MSLMDGLLVDRPGINNTGIVTENVIQTDFIIEGRTQKLNNTTAAKQKTIKVQCRRNVSFVIKSIYIHTVIFYNTYLMLTILQKKMYCGTECFFLTSNQR